MKVVPTCIPYIILFQQFVRKLWKELSTFLTYTILFVNKGFQYTSSYILIWLSFEHTRFSTYEDDTLCCFYSLKGWLNELGSWIT
jgi:hypothetical protein